MPGPAVGSGKMPKIFSIPRSRACLPRRRMGDIEFNIITIMRNYAPYIILLLILIMAAQRRRASELIH